MRCSVRWPRHDRSPEPSRAFVGFVGAGASALPPSNLPTWNGFAVEAVGMSKTSILRSIKAGRISAGRDELGQWAIEPRELHRVYPPLTDDTAPGNGPEQRGGVRKR